VEGIFFLILGGALFAHSWHLLGMYSDGRTMGIILGGLGILTLYTTTMDPLVVESVAKHALIVGSAMKALMFVWAIYMLIIAAHGIFDFDERPIGFYSSFLAVVTFALLLLFAGQFRTIYGETPWLAFSIASFALTIKAALSFFYFAFSYGVLRLVNGWFALLGGILVGIIGLSMLTGAL
tara:strand:+ start:6975 stop:7514 length:540 start_codon:yes stop_codon:yes gene_type:complete